MLSNIALAMAALAHLGLTSAEVFMIEAIGFAGAGWSVSGNGCNTPRSSSVQCEPVEYEDINAQVGDILVFTYQQFHNVFQHETAAKAEACDFNGGTLVGRENVGSVYDRDLRITGFQYKLTEAGDFGFSCARSGNNPAWKTIGQHCNHGQRVTVHVAPPGAVMEIDWIIKPYDDMTAVVGDTINFKYNSYHDVHLHPSGSCDRAGAVLIGDNADGDATRGGVSHQFTEPGSYTFACQMGSHCDSGQIVTVVVTAGGSCTGDVTGDGVVGVGDVLQVLSAFGSSSFTTEDINGDGVVNVGDILATLGAFGSSCAERCSRGDDCGGQAWTDCGSACPPTCGEEAGFCTDNCVEGFFCPRGKMYDPIGLCVEASECSVGAPELPPGVAIGRPFMASDVPVTATVEEMTTDWCL